MVGIVLRKEVGLWKSLSECEASLLFFTFVSEDEMCLTMILGS